MKLAEKKCRKLRVGLIEWYVELELAITRHRYWTLVLSRLDGHRISAQRLVRMAAELGLDNPGPMERDALIQQIYEAQEHYKETKQNAPALRGKWMEDLCIAKAEKGLESAATGIKVMYHSEKG